MKWVILLPTASRSASQCLTLLCCIPAGQSHVLAVQTPGVPPNSVVARTQYRPPRRAQSVSSSTMLPSRLATSTSMRPLLLFSTSTSQVGWPFSWLDSMLITLPPYLSVTIFPARCLEVDLFSAWDEPSEDCAELGAELDEGDGVAVESSVLSPHAPSDSASVVPMATEMGSLLSCLSVVMSATLAMRSRQTIGQTPECIPGSKP